MRSGLQEKKNWRQEVWPLRFSSVILKGKDTRYGVFPVMKSLGFGKEQRDKAFLLVLHN